MPDARPRHLPPGPGEVVGANGYIMKPCSWCGGPKPTDGSAHRKHTCSDACRRAARQAHDRSWRERMGVAKPCIRCGGDKGPNPGRAVKICAKCRENDHEYQLARWREKGRARRRARLVPVQPVVEWIDALGYESDQAVAELLAAPGDPWSSADSAARQLRNMRRTSKLVADRNVELIGLRLAGEPDLTAKLFPELVESWLEELA